MMLSISDILFESKCYGIVRKGNRSFLRNYHRELKNKKGLTFGQALNKLTEIQFFGETPFAEWIDRSRKEK